MRRTVIIVPDLVSFDALRQKLPTLQAMAELGSIFKLAPVPPVETPEALWLGMSPGEGQLKQGPLTVAALGADPPDRSTHFHLTTMSFNDGTATEIPFEIAPEDHRALFEQARRLNTRSLTIVEGQDRDHGLVWEALRDLGTTSAPEVSGKNIDRFLPDGDGDVELRRFIDDSINLLTELPLNEQRLDEGLAPINLLWPWGQGVRKPVPNLALKRGERADVFSGNLRLAGLSRLAGYKHAEVASFGKGVNTRLELLSENVLQANASISFIDAAFELTKRQKQEEVNWLAHEMDDKLLKPLFTKALTESTILTFIVPLATVGMGLTFQTGNRGSNTIPFDERALEEKSLTTRDVWDVVERGLLIRIAL